MVYTFEGKQFDSEQDGARQPGESYDGWIRRIKAAQGRGTVIEVYRERQSGKVETLRFGMSDVDLAAAAVNGSRSDPDYNRVWWTKAAIGKATK